MISSKKRAKLKSIANNLNTTLYIGKNGISDSLIKQLQDALVSNEIVKCKVLNNCISTAKEMAILLSNKSDSDIVQVIGSRFVLYKKNQKNPLIEV